MPDRKKNLFFANYFVSDVTAKLPFSFSSRLKITIVKMSDNAMRNLWCTILKLYRDNFKIESNAQNSG